METAGMKLKQQKYAFCYQKLNTWVIELHPMGYTQSEATEAPRSVQFFSKLATTLVPLSKFLKKNMSWLWGLKAKVCI